MASVSRDAHPFVFTDREELANYLGRTDVLVFVVSPNLVELPQFGLAVEVENFDAPGLLDHVSRLLRQLLAHFAALDELPDEYRNEQEQAQMEVVHQVFLPWLGRQMARHPAYFEMPPVDLPEGDGLQHLTRA